MMPYTKFLGNPKKENNLQSVTGYYQPDPNTSGYVHTFTYNKTTDTVTSNIMNGDVSDEDAKRIKRIIESKIK